jgi:hypothetical protein
MKSSRAYPMRARTAAFDTRLTESRAHVTSERGKPNVEEGVPNRVPNLP